MARPTPHTYTCSAYVRGYAFTQVVVAPGGQETATLVKDGVAVTLSVALNAAADRVKAGVTITRDGQVLHSEESTVSLERMESGISPAQ